MRRLVGAGLRALVSAALLAALVHRLGAGALLEAARSARLGWLAVAAGVMLVSNVLGACQWHRLLKLGGVHLSLARAVEYALVGVYFNNFLPSTIGGDLTRVVDASRATGQRATIVAATLMDRTLGLVMLAGLAVAGLGVAAERGLALAPGPALHLAVVAVALGALVLLAALVNDALARRLARLAQFLPAAVERAAEQGLGALAAYQNATGSVLALLAVSAVIQCLRILTHACVARALDIELDLVYFFLFVPVLAILVMLPISINGIGVRESMGALLFGTAGVAAPAASAMQFLAYLVAVVASLVGGILFALRPRNPRPKTEPHVPDRTATNPCDRCPPGG